MDEIDYVAKRDYSGYSVLFLPEFLIRYLEDEKYVDFFYDLGGGVNNVVIVSARPISRSERLLPADVARALERINEDLKSVGYTVIVN
ncbi:hypothetical protein [Prosthecobacter sp.]|uniref:hypothetical protein n=1 Tax=Prosthecobacter sp. TaxID=1965333 RepID=UPI003783C46C